MHHQRTIWTLVAVTVALALVAGLVRQVLQEERAETASAEERIAQALALLEKDPAAWEAETQDMVREAATLAERGALRSAEAHYILALQYQRERNLAGAEALYKRAISERPGWSWPYAGLGNLLGRHTFGREREAEEALDKALSLEPGWWRPHNILAVLYRVQDRLEEAEEEALTALRLNPEDIATHNNYANLLVALGRLEEAEEHYRTASQRDPRHPKPYYNLACLFALQGRTEEALDNLGKALKKAPVLRGDAAVDPDLAPLRGEAVFRWLVYGEEKPQ